MPSLSSADTTRKIWILPLSKVLLDVGLLMCVGFPILFLFLWGQPYQRGFFCDDEDLNHPYHESTVPTIYLYVVGIIMNVIMMILVEYLNQENTNEDIIFLSRQVPKWMYNSYCVILVFAFGMACSQLTTDIFKYTIGRLRPHFLYVCKPNVCCLPSNSSAICRNIQYWTEFNCTNQQYLLNSSIIKDMRLSFPSGHSSFSVYTMLYFSIYLHKRMVWNGSTLMKHTLQFAALLAALFTACTRVSDYKHHWSDVLAGLIIGTIAALITAICFSDLFGKTFKMKGNFKKDGEELQELNNGNRCSV